MDTARRFKDRMHAGRELARKLQKFRLEQPLILGLPRGGIPVAFEVARELRAPLDIIAARKVGAPYHPEYGIGAVAPGEVLILDTDALRTMSITMRELERIVEHELEESRRREKSYRSGEWSRNTPSSTVIVVDDGLATGITAKAALESVRMTYAPEYLVFAAPVCARSSLDELVPHADEVVCVENPAHFIAVSYWYRSFPETRDREVVTLLEEAYAMRTREVQTYA